MRSEICEGQKGPHPALKKMGICKPEIVERATMSAEIYLSFAVVCPILAFTVAWKRRRYFPIYPAPRNWAVYAVVIGFGPLVLSTDNTWPFLIVVLGDSRVVDVCMIRLYTHFIGSVGCLLAMLLSFAQVLARYEFADLQCELLFVEEAAENSEMARGKAAELHKRLRVVQPRTNHRKVFHTWWFLLSCYAAVLIIIDLAHHESWACAGRVNAEDCNSSCIVCPVAGITHLCVVFFIQGCAIVLLICSRWKNLSDEFGILLEHQTALYFFLPFTVLHLVLAITLPGDVMLSWPQAVVTSCYSSILPCAVFCGWPAVRTFRSRNYSLIQRPSHKKVKAIGEVPNSSIFSKGASRGEKPVKPIHSKASNRGETLDAVLASPVGKRALVEFLIREFSVESILFWHECTALKEKRRQRQQPHESATRGSIEKKYIRNERRVRLNEPLTAVREVFRQYVAEGAVHEVNLPHTLRVRLTNAIAGLETAMLEAMPSRFQTDPQSDDSRLVKNLWDSLDACLAEIVQVLENDTFPRFIRSPQYVRYQNAFSAAGSFEQHNVMHCPQIV